MRTRAELVAAAALVLTGVIACQPAPEPAEARAGVLELAITRAPADRALDATSQTPDGRYPAGTEIALVRPDDGSRAPEILSRGLAAAGAPEVAPDGRRLAFAGRSDDGAAWRIYELEIAQPRPVPVTEGDSDCVDPAYLGGGDLVFSCDVSDTEDDDRWELFLTGGEGSPARRISFTVGSASWPSALEDGRILFSLRSSDRAGLFVVNPDGTQLQPFAATHADASEAIPGRPIRGRQTFDGGVLFLDTDKPPLHRLERVDMNRPLSSRRVLLPATAPEVDAGDRSRGSPAPFRVRAAEPLADGSILLSGSAGPEAATLGIYRRGLDGNLVEVWDDPGHHELEAVPVAPWPMPRGRPSTVDASAATGQLLCLDAGHGDGIHGPGADAPRVAEVEIIARWAQTEETARVPARSDGSFFVEVPADRPLRVRTLDAGNRPIATSDWFWLRPGEIRTCFGCHEPREQAPPNRLVEAIADPPLTPWSDGTDGGLP